MDDRIRTSDADRERVTARLREHFAEGRLTREELDERITAALSARTFGQLRRVLADLPEPAGTVAAPRPPRQGWPAGGPAPYLVAFRRGPRLLPIVALALLVFVLVPGAGAAAVALKILAVAAACMVVLWALTMFAAARFIRRIRRQWNSGADRQFQQYAWTWPGPHARHARSWRA
ncbi:MAG TPA: DUF1707 domain-containing protein [Streptosporangiaceae bacterium]|nr:DUF1707 domain-containing protein [Streptosporangiaceae bacterium]